MTTHKGKKATSRGLGTFSMAITLTVIAFLAFASSAAAQTMDVRSIPPSVLMILDSSASMEYLQHEHLVPTCKDNPAVDDPAKRTRWMMALDALLGPIDDESYHCEFTMTDGRIVPHFIPKGERDFAWGILERYRELVRFGLGTFDSFHQPSASASGMYSYGPSQMGANYGLKREQEVTDPEDIGGALISFGADDVSFEEVNNAIRLELEQVRPYCGSPVAAALDDTEYFFSTHPDNTAYSLGGNDHYAKCRQKFTILITDGMPNAGEGTYYGTSPMEAADLWNISLNEADDPYANVPVYVIGLSTCPCCVDREDPACPTECQEDGPLSFEVCPSGPGTTGEWEEICGMLNEIAHMGCPPDQPNCPDGAYFASNTYELMDALDAILAVAVQNANSRTLAMTTNLVGEHAGTNVVQYQFNTSLIPGTGTDPWTGILERSSYVCNDLDEVELSTDAAEYLDYGEALNLRAIDRKLYTSIDTDGIDPSPDRALIFDTTSPELTATVLGRPDEDQIWANEIIDFIHGRATTPRETDRLADPFHASAALLEPPLMDLPIVSYYQYQLDQASRPTVLFLATNDGVLHAFRVQDTGDSAERGEELWGYVPGIVLDKVHRQYPYSHDWNLDSTPIVRDIRVKKNLSTLPGDEEWMSILVGGLRQGGQGYYALDVTEPEQFDPGYIGSDSDLLWEVDKDSPGFEDLALTYATPFIGNVFVPDPDDTSHALSELAAVVFPGGLDPVDRSNTTSLYVVSAKTGTLIKKLDPEFPPELGCSAAAPDCSAHPECCAQLVSNPVGFGSLAGLVTTRIFVGDDRGRLWRADLASSDPDDWHLTLFYPDPDPFLDDPTMPYLTAEPVENPIGLAIDKEGKLVVLFGTGNVDDLPGMGQNYLFSLTEEYVWDSTNSMYLGKARFNWQINFEQGEKLLGQPIVFDEVAYFSTFIPYTDDEDYCIIGEGRIWGVNYNSVDPNMDDVALSGWDVSTEPEASDDFAQLDQDGLEGGDKDLYQSYDNTLISGLTIIQRPSCLDIDVSTGVDFGGGQNEVYELVAQVSGPGGTRQGNQQTPTITMRIPAPSLQSHADSWGSVIE